MKKLLLINLLCAIFFSLTASAQCAPPTQIAAVDASQTTVVIAWDDMAPSIYMIWIQPAGAPAPLYEEPGIPAGTSPYVHTGLVCGTAYDVYLRKICDGEVLGEWSQPVTVSTS